MSASIPTVRMCCQRGSLRYPVVKRKLRRSWAERHIRAVPPAGRAKFFGNARTLSLLVCSAFTRVAACTLAPVTNSRPAIRRLQPFRHLHDCSRCFRLERWAGWGLHPLESAALSAGRTINRVVLAYEAGRDGFW